MNLKTNSNLNTLQFTNPMFYPQFNRKAIVIFIKINNKARIMVYRLTKSKLRVNSLKKLNLKNKNKILKRNFKKPIPKKLK